MSSATRQAAHQADHESFSLGAFFSYGFRPFFLGSAVWAVLAMALWLAWIAIHAAGGSLAWISIAGAPHVWHAHEMVFGFAAAAVAGFLLTAVPNWTGARAIRDWPLGALFAVWVAGRVAMSLSALLPSAVVSTIDIVFLPALGGLALRQMLVKPERKNMVFLAMLAAMTLANVVFHLAEANVIAVDSLAPIRFALLILALLVTIIGGRIVPAFTHNWLHLNAPAYPMPRRSPRLDAVAVATVVALVIAALLGASDAVLGTVALAAGIANGMRLAGWRGIATRKAPIVLVLHLGYAWLVVGYFALAVSAFFGVLSEAAALHALATGAVGTMILAVMSRAALGHTGRPLVAPPAIALSYGLVTAAALARTFGPALWPSAYNQIMIGAGILWMAAFGLFAIVYAPILTTPRVHQRVPGA